MSVLRWNSPNPTSASSGQATAPSSPAPVPDIRINVGDCPAGKGVKRFNAIVTLEYGPTAPPVNVTLTVDGAPRRGALSFTRVGTSSDWRATASFNDDLGERQAIGLQWSSTSGSPSFADVTLSVVATDWGDID